MEKIEPTRMAPKWEREDFFLRLTNCRIMLAIHGFLTNAENIKIQNRTMKELTRGTGSDQ